LRWQVRYLINSPRLPNRRKTQTALTLRIRNDPPEKDNESNWLPAPNGPI
jgi:hypothetical protein